MPKLLELLSLTGCVVTADAMSCQRKIAQQVVDQGGDYVLALKGNQARLYDDVRRFLDDPETVLASARDTDKGHGRIEITNARLQQGDLIAALSGPLAVTERGTLNGEFQLVVVNFG